MDLEGTVTTMVKKFFLTAVALMMLSTATLAMQDGAAGQDAANADISKGDVALRIKRLDLLNQILPVLFTKEQFRQLLPVIERSRAEEKKHLELEQTKMKEKSAKVEAAIKAAEEKGELPPDELIAELAQLHRALFVARQALVAQQTEKVVTAMKTILNEGQIKAAANSLDPRIFNPEAKVEDMSDDEKLSVWTRYVLMDPLAYDILLALNKNAK